MDSILSILTSAVIFISDLFIKNTVDRKEHPHKELCHGRIIITKLHNKGIMLGKLSDKESTMKILISISMVLTYILYIPLLFKKGHSLAKLGFGMLLGGAWSNFYDHFFRGYVVDYIRIPYGFIKKLVFNISDFFIFIGTVIAAIFSIFSR